MSISDWPVTRNPVTGCWEWTGKLDKDGYARTQSNELAHRVVYEQEVGPVPKDKQPDHLCRIRKCTAPYHIEPVTKRENERRKQMRHRVKIRKCPQGHDLFLNGINTIYGGKVCGYCSGVRPLRTK